MENKEDILKLEIEKLKLENKNLSVCSNCGEPVLSHKACPSCGYYNKKQAVEIKTKEEKKENN